MGIGLALNRIECNLETASGGWARRRDRQRARGSDELAIIAMMQSLDEGAGETSEPLAYYKYYRENVDTGDTFLPEQSMLAPNDSSNQLLVSLIALEIDGRGSGADKVDRMYQAFKRNTPETTDWWTREYGFDVIAIDRFSASRAPFGAFINHAPGFYPRPDGDDYSILQQRGIEIEASYNVSGGRFLANRIYRSSTANSVYSLGFEFRLE